MELNPPTTFSDIKMRILSLKFYIKRDKKKFTTQLQFSKKRKKTKNPLQPERSGLTQNIYVLFFSGYNDLHRIFHVN